MANDFLKILSDLGQTVSLEKNTETFGNISDQKTNSYGAASSITVLIGRNRPRYALDKEGLVEQGDKTMYSLTTSSVEKNDRITHDGNKYIVHDVSRTNFAVGNTSFVCDYCILFISE